MHENNALEYDIYATITTIGQRGQIVKTRKKYNSIQIQSLIQKSTAKSHPARANFENISYSLQIGLNPEDDSDMIPVGIITNMDKMQRSA